jgi:hypothetical protein
MIRTLIMDGELLLAYNEFETLKHLVHSHFITRQCDYKQKGMTIVSINECRDYGARRTRLDFLWNCPLQDNQSDDFFYPVNVDSDKPFLPIITTKVYQNFHQRSGYTFLLGTPGENDAQVSNCCSINFCYLLFKAPLKCCSTDDIRVWHTPQPID